MWPKKSPFSSRLHHENDRLEATSGTVTPDPLVQNIDRALPFPISSDNASKQRYYPVTSMHQEKDVQKIVKFPAPNRQIHHQPSIAAIQDSSHREGCILWF